MLSREIHDFENNPMKWMEPLLIELAGEMQLESAIPIIIDKLKINASYLSEQCMYALIKIGTDSALRAIYEAFPKADVHFRLYASGVFPHVHSDTSVEKSLDLLPREKDHTNKTGLAIALLSNFAYEGIQPVRELIIQQQYDRQYVDLRASLITTCIIMEKHFPEFEGWRTQIERERAERERISQRRMHMAPTEVRLAKNSGAKKKLVEMTPVPVAAGRNTRNAASIESVILLKI